jgi:hypothetical protein
MEAIIKTFICKINFYVHDAFLEAPASGTLIVMIGKPNKVYG